MKYDDQKISEVVLALLGVFEFENGRAWKRIEFSVMEELFEKRLYQRSQRQIGVSLLNRGRFAAG